MLDYGDNLAYYSDDEIESMLDWWIDLYSGGKFTALPDNAPGFSFDEVQREYIRRENCKE